jgi:hypothetical protein
LCIDGTELAFADRTSAYVRNGLAHSGFTAGDCFDCALLNEDEVFDNPAGDDAPWYEPNVAASADFLGISPTIISLLPVTSRSVKQLPQGGGIVGALTPKPRILTFTGLMIASSAEGMAYGDRWVSDVLAGQSCPSGCTLSEVEILPACPDATDYDDFGGIGDRYIRRLIDAACVDGPVFSRVGGLPEHYIQEVAFQIAAGQPYLFSPEIGCVDEDLLTAFYDEPTSTCCEVTTEDWPGDAVVNITVTAETAATNIVLTAKPTFDGICPNDEGALCWKITIPELPEEGVITVDSVRKQLLYRDPSLKQDRSALRMVNFDGALTFPEVAPCSTLCICASAGGGDVVMSVSKIIREF